MYVGYAATVAFKLLRKSKCVLQIYVRRTVMHVHGRVTGRTTGGKVHTSKEKEGVFMSALLLSDAGV